MWWWHSMQQNSSYLMKNHPANMMQQPIKKHQPSDSHVFKVPGPPLRVKNKIRPGAGNVKGRSRKRSTSKSSHKEKKRRNKSRSASRRRRVAVEQAEDSDMFCDINIDEDLLKFLSASAKHRRERDAKKKEEEKDENFGELTIDFDTFKGTSAAPKERPGLRRTAEMKMLYGKGAAMIHGMETAMQLTFDRNVDIKQPKPWPNLPINIKFN